jgi:hypothetical protein
MVKGHVNQTNRKRILQSEILPLKKKKIEWKDPDTGRITDIPHLSKKFDLLLADDVPGEAEIWVFCFSKYDLYRFFFGTKSNRVIPDDLSMPKIGLSNLQWSVRIVDPENPGLLLGKSARKRESPPNIHVNRKKSGKISLLQYSEENLHSGIPSIIRFPMNDTNQPIRIVINKEDSPKLFHALHDGETLPQSYLLTAYLSTIVQRLVNDAVNEYFDPNEYIFRLSNWQNHWNHLFRCWTSKGLQDFDYTLPDVVDSWTEDIISYWSISQGNPAKTIDISLGGN